MEIIHLVLGKANPERMNGVNKVVYQLASRQSAWGRKVSVWGITPSTEHNYGERNFETRLFKAFRNPFKADPMLLDALAQLNDGVVIHIHGGWIPVFSTIARHLERLRIPFVLTPHGAYNKVAIRRSAVQKFFYFHLFEKQVIQRARRIHCIGESEVTGLKQVYPNSKSFLLPYGFEPLNAINDRGTRSSKSFIIGYVGRLDIHTKGLDLLLKAFQIFAVNNPLARLWIIGDGPERHKLERAIVLKLSSSVVLWGSKYGDDKVKLLSRMDVFAHPSRNEGMPSAVLEAASLGVPGIVSEATNIGRYIEKYNAGIVVPNEDVDALVQAFKKISEKKDQSTLEEMSNGSRRMVREVFDWNSIVQQFDALYKAE